MLKAGGWRIITEPGKPDIENDTFTCAHGNDVVRVLAGHLPKYEDGRDIEFCPCCKGPLCKQHALEYNASLKCVPFEARLEQMESRARFRRSLG